MFLFIKGDYIIRCCLYIVRRGMFLFILGRVAYLIFSAESVGR